MIRMIKGTYGLVKNGTVEPMTKHSPAFSINAAREAELVEAGVQFITLLALSDEGAPAYDRALAAKLAALGVPSFACTPDAFPGLMAAAIRKEDINAWAAGQGLVATAKGGQP